MCLFLSSLWTCLHLNTKHQNLLVCVCAVADVTQNVTAIVDKDQSVCFIMHLNRTLVKPPRNFWDMMLKLKVYIAAGDLIDSDSSSGRVSGSTV